MDMKLQRLAMDMLIRYGIRGETDIAQIPYSPQKTGAFSACVPQRDLPCSSPEAEGISSAHLTELVKKIEAEKTAFVHNLLILRHGRIICEACAPGYSTDIWCLTHSMAKSITALAVGMLIDDGKLSLGTRVCDILREECPAKMSAATRSLSVWHLLSMSCGITGLNEATSVVEDHWVRAFFESTPVFEPGTAFRYNSLNTYILSAVIRKITGKGLTELLTERLWKPLGIRNFQCECSPEGIEKGGWGMYIAPQDMAKLGILYLNGGLWHGKRIISENWLNLMSQTTFVTSNNYGDFNYGLHLWVARDKSAVLFSGMLGQNLWICPKNRIVAVITSGNSEVFQRQPILFLLSEYLGAGYTPEFNPIKGGRFPQKQLKRACRQFGECNRFTLPLTTPTGLLLWWLRIRRKNPTPLPPQCERYIGRYLMEKNNAGILPMFVRFMQNNHTKGISALTLSVENGRFLCTIEEGEALYCFEVGLYGRKRAELNFNGEPYLVSTQGEFCRTEDGDPMFKIELVFPELPNIRRIKLYPTADGIKMALSEIPGKPMIDALINSYVPESLRGGGIAGFIRTRMFGADPLKCIGPAVEPELLGKRQSETARLQAAQAAEFPSGENHAL